MNAQATRASALILVAVATLLAGCQTTPYRRPVEESLTAPEFAEAAVTDVVVLPIESSGGSNEARFPSDDMRHMLRVYLIQRKNYAIPRSEWVDVQLAERGPGADLETDAELAVRVDQWDLESLAARGVVYASATFELRNRADGRKLWTYSCQDLQLPVAGPYRGQEIEGNMKAAARKLAEAALSRFPKN